MPPTHKIRGPLSLAFGALETLISDQDAAYIDDALRVGAPPLFRLSLSRRWISTSPPRIATRSTTAGCMPLKSF